MAGRALSVAACLLATLAQGAAAHEVGLELVLAVDCSLSVNDPEYSLQMEGIAAALRSPAVSALILDQPGGVALTVMQWSGTATTHQAVPWRLLATLEDVESFAADTAAAPRAALSYYTAIGHAITGGIRLIEGNDFEGREKKDRHFRRWAQQFRPAARHRQAARDQSRHHHQWAGHPHR